MDMNDCEINIKLFQKMIFIYNALHSGWKIHIKNDQYVFTKNHDNNPQYFNKNYLNKFIESNLKIN